MAHEEFAAAREALLKQVEDEVAETAAWTGRRKLSTAVRDALLSVPREAFVPADSRHLAYVNAPLAIGHGQTISQPYIVAIMSELLDLTGSSTVLEIGTGCGYQAAILSVIAARVYTIEYIAALAADAADRLQTLGFGNIEVRHGDGRKGWPEKAPFDGIIVTAAGAEIPDALIEQLAPGGKLIVPVGSSRWTQKLVRVTKDETGNCRRETLLPVAFVPLVGAD
ncbi:MAG: protein-L-isoaspartate(D-aspartate) O-methyltransferase [Alphaproteobacteria bacterium]|nr:protein-L-isoaspartate(D-aspartate) O-methyltransferase [Alphaproteobacteria bacterium]